MPDVLNSRSMPLLFSTCVMISDSIVPNDITNIIAFSLEGLCRYPNSAHAK